MKKYKLIEYDPLFSKEYHNVDRGIYNQLSDAYAVMAEEQKKYPNFYYRIEEVEESIMDRVKSYEDACEVIGIRPNTARDIYENGIPEHIETLLKLETITAALNEGWKPDWENDKEKKWHVYWNFEECECRVDYSTYSSSRPSRLYFKFKNLAEYAAKQFADLYKQLFD